MPIEPSLLQQLLDHPSDKDVADSPIATAILLEDPANAALLVPYLDGSDSKYEKHARSLLCNFKYTAVPFILDAILLHSAETRSQGIKICGSILKCDDIWRIKETIELVSRQLEELFADHSDLPEPELGHTEIDFRGRVCDLVYLIIDDLLHPGTDQSEFRAADDKERDQIISRFRSGGTSLRIA